jgi:heat shock protein HslJ
MTKFFNPYYVAGLVGLWLVLAVSVLQAESRLKDTRWQFVEFQSMDDSQGIQKPHDASQYTMQLNADGSVNMQLNCNRARGSWSATPGPDSSDKSFNSGQFNFGPLAMTRALCPPPSMDEFIAMQSSYVRSYVIKDNRLYLSLMADGGIFVWEPVVDEAEAAVNPVSPEQGGPRNWEVTNVKTTLNMREQPSISAPVIARLSPGQILDNLDCLEKNGRHWCDVQPLGGGLRGYVSHEYLKPAIGPNGAVITGNDDSAYRAGQGDFDAKGKIPCAAISGQPMQQCDFAVARSGPGYATVIVTKPDGMTRSIYFRMGIAIGAGTSEADYPGEFSARKDLDLNLIELGAERFEIPDAVVLGG